MARRRDIVTPSLRRDPVLTAAIWWTVLAVILFFVLSGRTEAQIKIFWAFQVPLDALLAYSAWRVQRIATGAIRRFWRVLAFCGVLFVCGDTAQAAIVLLDAEGWSTEGGPVQGTCFTIGLALILLAMLVHPHPQRSSRERAAFWLDSATVLVGGAVVIWCFSIDPEHPGDDIIVNMATGAVILTSAFASVKMIISGNAPMHKAAATTMIASAGVNAVGFFLAPNGATALPAYVLAARFLPSLLIAAGPRIQEIIARFDETAFGSRRRKPYSLLPYGSIAVVFGTLIVILLSNTEPGQRPDARLWGVVAGLGLIVALVAGRQLVAFHDNTRLIAELDHTLDELREHEVRLRHQAHYDGLTGLANRTHLHDEMAETLATCDPGTVSLLLIDLDGFKTVNDTLGHATGDALLAGVADKLNDSVRSGDLVARLGGDEFAVLLRDCDMTAAEHTARRILKAMETPVSIGSRQVHAAASIGVACAEADDDIESLLRAADVAMYAAKRQGKGCWQRYEPSMETAG